MVDPPQDDIPKFQICINLTPEEIARREKEHEETERREFERRRDLRRAKRPPAALTATLMFLEEKAAQARARDDLAAIRSHLESAPPAARELPPEKGSKENPYEDGGRVWTFQRLAEHLGLSSNTLALRVRRDGKRRPPEERKYPEPQLAFVRSKGFVRKQRFWFEEELQDPGLI